MEVAGQWRREWAGTAEYGKVIEGGVTKRVARAMEVLNASAPGARVRVMRAAYHSSSGPGASSYMMHSSRQVLSSGYNFLEPPSLPTKPLEISSMPLDSSPDSETENYKVTEPDDFDISEPSKWRRSTGTSSIRMPSEESSSADNASIIDLDSRSSSRSTFRRSFNGKQDIKGIKGNERVSPLLDAPTALSTLKYTSLLNASDEWNNRRKSYSFEDTSPLNKGIAAGVNLSIESSTDSGICKSTEIFHDSNNSTILQNDKIEHNSEIKQDFKDWLSKNRRNSYKEIKISPIKFVHDTKDNNITLQSNGKVSLKLPVGVSYTDTPSENQSRSSDESDRKTKKVEFCKTELHFAADTGTVNIIATDEKPPPSNDFRRRKSAFVPLNDKSDRPITLFGIKPEITEIDTNYGISNYSLGDSDENTAATKGILKNKIPKPKPYLLGENMVFGTSNDTKAEDVEKPGTVMSAVSLINRQLQSERRYSNDTTSSVTSDVDLSPQLNEPYRTTSQDPQLRGSSHQRILTSKMESSFKYSSKIKDSKPFSASPTSNRSKIRELRDSELAYFGIPNHDNVFMHNQDNLQEEILHSVKLVQKISNSVCSSEAESDDGHEYQNISPSYKLKMQPTPKPRTKYSDVGGKITETTILHSITEQDTDLEIPSKAHRTVANYNKEPLHQSHKQNENAANRENIVQKSNVRKSSVDNSSSPRKEYNSLKREKERKNSTKEKENLKLERKTSLKEIRKPESPVYVNVDAKNNSAVRVKKSSHDLSLKQKNSIEKRASTNSRTSEKERIPSLKSNEPVGKNKENRYTENRENNDRKSDEQSPSVKKRAQKRTEKLCTPENPPIYSTRHNYSVEKKPLPKREEAKCKPINNGSLNKNNVHNTSKISKENGSVTKTKKDSEYDSSKTDIIKIPNISTVHKQIQSNGTSSSKNTTKSQRDTLNSEQSLKSNQSKLNNTKVDKPVKPHRSKYVINYNDKNGTVSSVCKIKTGPVHQQPQWTQDKKNRQKRKSKHDQRSCQLL